jgi:hypothetical protein
MGEEFTGNAKLLAWKFWQEFIILQARNRMKIVCCGAGATKNLHDIGGYRTLRNVY